MYHAKALHISSIFLPKPCPLVQHITQSYNKNYLREKKEFKLENFLEDLGLKMEPSEPSFEPADMDEGPTFNEN
jgi:hypothetical protein